MRAPSGTVTFLFTDIEGSTCLRESGVRRTPHAVLQPALSETELREPRAKGEAMDRGDAVGDAIAEMDPVMAGMVDM